MAVTVTTVSAPVERLSSAGVPEREQVPVVDDGEPVAELVGLLHVVRGEEDGLALAVQLAEDLPQREAALRVEAGGGLVEEERSPGRCMIARATIRRCAMPPESAATGSFAALGQAELLEQPVGLALARPCADIPKKRPWK